MICNGVFEIPFSTPKIKTWRPNSPERLASMFFVVGKGCIKKFLWKFYFVVSIFVYSFASINFIILNVIWENKP